MENIRWNMQPDAFYTKIGTQLPGIILNVAK